MRTNITLRMDGDLIREVKILAARRGISVSRMLAGQLEQMVRGEKAYEAARKRALRRLSSGWSLGWTRPQDRGKLHER